MIGVTHSADGNGICHDIFRKRHSCISRIVVLDPIQHLKVDHLGNRNPRLHTDETLIALSICAATNPMAEMAMQQLSKLRGCDVHSSVILSSVDEKTFKRLGVNLTCEPRYAG